MESMERELFLENLDAVVERIIELHTTSSERWCETNDHMMPNLKKTQVSDAYGNNDILLTILQYRNISKPWTSPRRWRDTLVLNSK